MVRREALPGHWPAADAGHSSSVDDRHHHQRRAPVAAASALQLDVSALPADLRACVSVTELVNALGLSLSAQFSALLSSIACT